MLIAILLATLLFGLVGVFHYATLSWAAHWQKNAQISACARMLVTLFVIQAAHILEAAIYAGGFKIGQILDIGGFSKSADTSMMDIFYFSLVNYTTLGLGDIYPTGHLRFIAGVEALNGFLLISCSASVIFMAVKQQTSE